MSIPPEERTFDWVPQFDERSRGYGIRAVIPEEKQTLRSYTWRCEVNLDQGREGACVGFGWTHDHASWPVPNTEVTYDMAVDVYHRAQKIDEFPGENYSGTSVLAGAKIAVENGWITSYRWAFGLDDALLSIARRGPVVIGVNWYQGMYEPDANGFLHPTGAKVGGHCTLLRGVNVKERTVTVHNSWGPRWGGTKYGPGTALLSWDDLGTLLDQGGEACVPLVR